MPKKYKPLTEPQLKPKQAKFVEELLKDGNQTRAAEAAGYSPTAAAGCKIANSIAVKAALEKVREKAIVTAAYNADTAMKEAEEAIEFAKETKNANAFVKAVELRSKLKGLLIEKHQHQVANFSLNIGGIDDEPKAVPSEVLASTTSSAEEDEEDEEPDVFT